MLEASRGLSCSALDEASATVLEGLRSFGSSALARHETQLLTPTPETRVYSVDTHA